MGLTDVLLTIFVFDKKAIKRLSTSLIDWKEMEGEPTNSKAIL
jgi:hypothetical protein